MKKLHFALAAAMVLSVTSCIRVTTSRGANGSSTTIGWGRGSTTVIEAGEPTKQTREIKNGYSGLIASSVVHVIVSPDVLQGTVVVRAGSNIINRIYAETRGDKLEIGITKGDPIRTNGGVTVLVPVQRYSHLAVSNNATITLPAGYEAGGDINVSASNNGEVRLGAGLKSYALKLNVSNNGAIKGDAVVENGVIATASNNGEIALTGHCTRPFVGRASNNGKIKCGNFVCEVAQCSASNNASVRIIATQSMSAEASNLGTIDWSGSAQLTLSRTANLGKVRKI